MNETPRVEVGRVVSVNPAKHEIRVKPVAQRARQLNLLETGWLASPGNPAIRVRFERVRMDRGNAIITVAAGVPRDMVRAFDRGTLWVEADALPAPDPEDWTVHDLLDMAVVAEDGTRIGTVVEVMEGRGNDVLTIARPDATRFLMPAVPEAIHAIDFEQGTVRVGDLTPFAVDDAH